MCTVDLSSASLLANVGGELVKVGADLAETPAAVLPTGGRTRLLATFPESCAASDAATGNVPGVVLDVASNRVPVARAQLPVASAACATDAMMPAGSEYAEDAGTGRFSALHAELTVPSSATPGQSLHYTVTLMNTGPTPVSFGGQCPTYTEYTGPSITTEATYTLNCDASGAIAPKQSQAYEMRVLVPAGASGRVKVGWVLADGPATGAQVETTP